MPKKRISFYLNEAENKELDRLKQVLFYDKSYAELYRYLIRLGLKECTKEKN